MLTIITHAAVPLCLEPAGLQIIPPRLLLAGVVLAMLPMPMCCHSSSASPTAMFGHRGFTHSSCLRLLFRCLRIICGVVPRRPGA